MNARWLAASTLFAIAVTSAPAQAEEGFDCQGGTGEVACSARAPWHINAAAPWKVTDHTGKVVIAPKSRFTLTEDSARVSGIPAGDVKVRVYVCKTGKCLDVSTRVTVK